MAWINKLCNKATRTTIGMGQSASLSMYNPIGLELQLAIYAVQNIFLYFPICISQSVHNGQQRYSQFLLCSQAWMLSTFAWGLCVFGAIFGVCIFVVVHHCTLSATRQGMTEFDATTKCPRFDGKKIRHSLAYDCKHLSNLLFLIFWNAFCRVEFLYFCTSVLKHGMCVATIVAVEPLLFARSQMNDGSCSSKQHMRR